MKYIIREKQKIFRGWNELGSLVTTPLLAEATVYATQESAQTALDMNNEPMLDAHEKLELKDYEIVEVTEKEIFKSKLKGE